MQGTSNSNYSACSEKGLEYCHDNEPNPWGGQDNNCYQPCAMVFAREFCQTVLLVDADLRKQNIHKHLRFDSEFGLGNHLIDDTPLSDIMVRPGVDKITLVSGGRTIIIMYHEFYGLKEKPFNVTPDPRFLYRSEKHNRALAYLESGIEEEAGFILLTGEIGTGKTTLIRHILNNIAASRNIAMIFNTNVSAVQLLELILQEFELKPIPGDKAKNLDTLYTSLIRSYARGRKPLLIIDEAQNLNTDALEEVRMLSNLQTDDKVLLQIMLVGQPELKDKLHDPALAQLNQRITVNYHLAELSEKETREYIAMRLEKAGGEQTLFSPEAVDTIFKVSQGVPRIINMLCDTALFYGSADELKVIDVEVVNQVINDRGGMGLLSGRDVKGIGGDRFQQGQADQRQILILEEKLRALEKHFIDSQATTEARLVSLEKRLGDREESLQKSEEKLRESEERFRTSIENMLDCFGIYSAIRDNSDKIVDFRIEYVNESACQNNGMTKEEQIGNRLCELLPFHRETGLFDEYCQLVETGKPLLKESLVYEDVYDQDSISNAFDIRAVKLGDGFAASWRDITDRKQTEEVLRESEERYRAQFETASDGIFVIDRQGKIIDVNESFARMHGYTVEELLELGLDQLDTPETTKHIPEKMHRILDNGEHLQFEVEHYHKNGHVFHLQVVANPIVIKGTRLVMAFHRDMTERKKAEEEKNRLEAQLQQVQKMEAIATLAGGIAHEFNNALTSIVGNIQLLEMDFADNKRVKKYIEAMMPSSHRMVNLTSQLLAYARGGKYQAKAISLSNFVEDTLPIIKPSFDPSIQVETDLPRDIFSVKADPAQMQMVLSAILSNSSEALEGEGCIRVITSNKEIDATFAKNHPELNPGNYVCLTVEDDGKGMDAETLNKIFDPFYTTKFMGRGLGMAAVYGIIRNHDGWISVDSERDKGTVVRIYLPAIEVEKKVKKEIITEPKLDIAEGEGTVLIIEDEEMVVNVSRAALVELGYRVLEAKTGKEAIEIAETFDGQIDLALLDIKLPDIWGDMVYPLIMKARPNLKVIVCSGYSIGGPAQTILDAGAQDFIQKPFSIQALSKKLKKVLEGK